MEPSLGLPAERFCRQHGITRLPVRTSVVSIASLELWTANCAESVKDFPVLFRLFRLFCRFNYLNGLSEPCAGELVDAPRSRRHRLGLLR